VRLRIGAALALVAAIGVAALVASAPALAQRGPHSGPGGGPGGFMAMVQSVATTLGMTPAELRTERQAGHSLADIAAARGVDQATLVQAVVAPAKTRLDEAVAAGRLTQQEADARFQRVQQFAGQMVANAQGPGPGGPRGDPEIGGAGLRGTLGSVVGALGLTPEEMRAERQAGHTLADVAAARGVDQATLLRAIVAPAKARLDLSVAAGRLTQQDADARLQQIEQTAVQAVTTSGPLAGPGFRSPRDGQGPRGGPGAGRGPRGNPGAPGADQPPPQ